MLLWQSINIEMFAQVCRQPEPGVGSALNFLMYHKDELTQKPNKNGRIKEFSHRKNQAIEAIDPKDPKIPNESTPDETGIRDLLWCLSTATRRILTEQVWQYFKHFHSPTRVLFFSNRGSGLSLSQISYLRRIKRFKRSIISPLFSPLFLSFLAP